MGFLQPLALLGLAAASIPALLHMLQRRVPPTVSFPAIRYLEETERRHSRRLKLRNLLLLILRTLLIIVIVLAAARPIVPLPIGDVHGPTAIAVIVDNSLSSSAVVEGQRTSDRISAVAANIIRRTTAEDHLWLVQADGIPRRMTSTTALLALDSLEPGLDRLDLVEATRAAASAVEADVYPGQVVVVSDFQQTALSAGDPPPVDVIAVQIADPPENRGIDSVLVRPSIWAPNGAVVAWIGGTGETAEPVRLVVGDQALARTVAAPGAEAVLEVSGLLGGWHQARVTIGPDELRADNAWHVALRVAPPADVRVEQGAGPFVSEAMEVLREAGRVVDGGGVLMTDRVGPGTVVLFPPEDDAQLGGVNRTLAARGVTWRFAERLIGEWSVGGTLGGLDDISVRQRYRLEGEGVVLAEVGGEPWVVRSGSVLMVGSRLDIDWTSLPISAAFLPFLDDLVNRVAGTAGVRVRASSGGTVVLPDGATALLTAAGRTPVSGDRRVVVPATAGVYYFSSADGDTLGAVEVNHDARETVLTPATETALRAAFGPDVDIVRPDGVGAHLFVDARRADLSGMFLFLAVALAIAELTVATAGGRASTLAG